LTDFPAFSKLVTARFELLSKGELYTVDDPTDQIYNLYLSSFPQGSNPIFKERTFHDCSCCKQFIRNIGNVVAIVNGKVETIWDLPGAVFPYDIVSEKLDTLVKSLAITNVFRSGEPQYGNLTTRSLSEDKQVITWNHFVGKLDRKHFSGGQSATILGNMSSIYQVFKRGLDEFSIDSLEYVLDMINDNLLYRGDEFKASVKEFVALKRKYTNLATKQKQNIFIWENINNTAARFRNTVIGTLVDDLSSGKDAEQAVRMFESKVAPANYKRPTALITPRMIQDAMKTLADLDLEKAVERRFAKISDVSINNVLFVDNSVKSKMKGGIEGLLLEAVKPVAFSEDKYEDISIDSFMSDILPKASSLELFVKNNHQNNFVSLTAPVHENSGKLFKWDNDFAWSYDGNITDSIKEKVKKAGGNITARMRVSLAWSNFDDLDLHVVEPNGKHIYFANKIEGGTLDVDMNAGGGRTREPVENIVWNNRILDGVYQVSVNQFSKRETSNVGFTLEFEFDKQIYLFSYPRAVEGKIHAISITIKNNSLVKVEGLGNVSSKTASQKKWGIDTESLVKVQTMMYSPNYWDDNKTGNKHWFFILENCLNDEPTRGMYNEFLNSNLEKHRKVFEVLGDKMKCPVTSEQLSGLGFSSTKSDSVLVLVKGTKLQKLYKINFGKEL
jgi:hypothetical protein